MSDASGDEHEERDSGADPSADDQAIEAGGERDEQGGGHATVEDLLAEEDDYGDDQQYSEGDDRQPGGKTVHEGEDATQSAKVRASQRQGASLTPIQRTVCKFAAVLGMYGGCENMHAWLAGMHGRHACEWQRPILAAWVMCWIVRSIASGCVCACQAVAHIHAMSATVCLYATLLADIGIL